MDAIRHEDDWEGDLIINLLISGQGKERRIWILTDKGKYTVPIADISVGFSSDEYSLPLYDPDAKTINLGQEMELANLPDKARILVNKVIQLGPAQKKQ